MYCASTRIKKVLTIAGSDSGGGAGIQADMKTFAALGVYGSSVITAVTAQNTLKVEGIYGVSPHFVEKQLDAVLTDIGADAVKTGMLNDANIIEVISKKLKSYPRLCLVVDPVMVATSGDRLLSPAGECALREKLLPHADFVTPNIEEASVLCGFTVANEEDIFKALRKIHGMGPDFVVITGMKKGRESVDFCYDGNEIRELKGPIVQTSSTHGTGCSFSAALAAFLAKGVPAWEAVAMAKDFIIAALRYAYRTGSGRGSLNHLASFFPGRIDDLEVLKTRVNAFHAWGVKPDPGSFPLLNVIIGGPLCHGKDYAELTGEIVKAGARLIQLREKEADTRKLVEMARKMREVCHSSGALLVVNDRVDVAAAAGADGVHLGQDDLSPRMARSILGPEKIIGVSAGNLAEAEAAVAEGADYLGVGPVYFTTSKECDVPPGGGSLIADVASQVKVPVIAIGGVTPENALPLLKAGAAGVAVISAVLAGPAPEREVERFMEVFANARRKQR